MIAINHVKIHRHDSDKSCKNTQLLPTCSIEGIDDDSFYMLLVTTSLFPKAYSTTAILSLPARAVTPRSLLYNKKNMRQVKSATILVYYDTPRCAENRL